MRWLQCRNFTNNGAREVEQVSLDCRADDDEYNGGRLVISKVFATQEAFFIEMKPPDAVYLSCKSVISK